METAPCMPSPAARSLAHVLRLVNGWECGSPCPATQNGDTIGRTKTSHGQRHPGSSARSLGRGTRGVIVSLCVAVMSAFRCHHIIQKLKVGRMHTHIVRDRGGVEFVRY